MSKLDELHTVKGFRDKSIASKFNSLLGVDVVEIEETHR